MGRIIIEGNPSIEAVFHEGTAGVAIIAHPHPLYGGNMDNNVVLALEEALRHCGLATLRFNFRGVGRSGGSHSGGRGEVEDMKLCYRFLRDRVKGVERFVVAGYSFGAYVASLFALDLERPAELILVSYPTSFYNWDHTAELGGRKIIISGEMDDIARKEDILRFYNSLKPPKELYILDTDHFYWGCEDKLKDLVKRTECSETVDGHKGQA